MDVEHPILSLIKMLVGIARIWLRWHWRQVLIGFVLACAALMLLVVMGMSRPSDGS